nr:RecName: Full=Unknown protein from spot 204 of 2D-PAGE of thylakoid [Pisum sativum]
AESGFQPVVDRKGD